jgi:N-acyl-phosphatidylethanolamine-hydrolysing phospholipase D
MRHLALLLFLPGCLVGTILRRNLVALVSPPRVVPERITSPRRDDVRLGVLWVGHATALIQLDDKFILTDPVFTQTVGAGFSRRLVEPGIALESLPPIDVAVVSHLHLDHLSVGTLELLAPTVRQLLLPPGGLVYVPDQLYETDEVERWQTFSQGELRLTAVPVKHPGSRFGVDSAWMKQGATGWVIEYRGLTVYFGGDTAYDSESFRQTAARFPKIDLALLPIGPVDPPSFARETHLDGREALAAFSELGASHFVPIHFDTFAHGVDEPGVAAALLTTAMMERGLSDDRVHVLSIGGQWGLTPSADASAPQGQP